MSAAHSNNIPTANPNQSHQGKQYGLIILGNSGVGKSFLANILLGRDAFKHEFSSSSVTHVTEFQEVVVNHLPLAIFNIPGLIEAKQERIDLNKKEIDKAFAQRPNSIIMFVFGQQNGRIRDEDAVAFNAINAAYPFKPESLVLVVNGLPKKRPADYEGTTLVLLQQLLTGVDWRRRNLCFLDHINEENADEKQHLKERLLQVVVEFTPSHHEKKQEIETMMDQLKEGQRLIKEQQVQFNAERAKYQEDIKKGQQMIIETDAKHKNEMQSLERAIKRQEEMVADQKRRSEEDNQRYQTQLQEMRTQMERAQENYNTMSKNTEATLEELRASRQAQQDTLKLFEELKNQPPKVEYIYEEGDSLCVIS